MNSKQKAVIDAARALWKYRAKSLDKNLRELGLVVNLGNALQALDAEPGEEVAIHLTEKLTTRYVLQRVREALLRVDGGDIKAHSHTPTEEAWRQHACAKLDELEKELGGDS